MSFSGSIFFLSFQVSYVLVCDFFRFSVGRALFILLLMVSFLSGLLLALLVRMFGGKLRRKENVLGKLHALSSISSAVHDRV